MGSLASVSILFSTIISVVISTTDVSLPVPKSLSMISSDSSEKVLSRKRRFFIPQTSGWLLKWVYWQKVYYFKNYCNGWPFH